MSYIKYNIDPDNKGQTEWNRISAYGVAFLVLAAIFGTIGCVFFAIYSIKELNKDFSIDIFLGLIAIIIIISILDFFFVFYRHKSKKKLSKIYFGFVFTILFIIQIIIGRDLKLSITSWNEECSIYVIVMIAIIFVLIILIVLALKELRDANIRLFTDKNVRESFDNKKAKHQLEDKNENAIIFCHVCGEKTTIESNFCCKCGCRLKC